MHRTASIPVKISSNSAFKKIRNGFLFFFLLRSFLAIASSGINRIIQSYHSTLQDNIPNNILVKTGGRGRHSSGACLFIRFLFFRDPSV